MSTRIADASSDADAPPTIKMRSQGGAGPTPPLAACTCPRHFMPDAHPHKRAKRENAESGMARTNRPAAWDETGMRRTNRAVAGGRHGRVTDRITLS